MKNRTIKIVIEETGDPAAPYLNKPFNVYLEGDLEGMDKAKPVEEVPPAHYWAARLFNACGEVLKDAEVVDSVHTNPRFDKQNNETLN